MMKAWSASRSAVLSRDEQVPCLCVSCGCTAAVNYQAQFIGCFKHVEVDILNSFFWWWWLFPLAHLAVFLWVYPPNVQFFWWFIGVSVNCEQGVVLSDQHLGRARLCSRLEKLHRCSLWAFRRGETVHYFQFDRNHVYENLWSELYGLYDEAVNLKE